MFFPLLFIFSLQLFLPEKANSLGWELCTDVEKNISSNKRKEKLKCVPVMLEGTFKGSWKTELENWLSLYTNKVGSQLQKTLCIVKFSCCLLGLESGFHLPTLGCTQKQRKEISLVLKWRTMLFSLFTHRIIFTQATDKLETIKYVTSFEIISECCRHHQD